MKQQDQINRAAGEAALQAAAEVNPSPTALVEFSSRGRVLVVGRDSAWIAAHRMADLLQPTVVSREADVADAGESSSAPSPAWGAAAL